jgi:hypothetical protein
MTRKHIDKRRFTHITTTDKGHIAQIIFGDLRNLLRTALELGSCNLHNYWALMTRQKYTKKSKQQTPYALNSPREGCKFQNFR